MKSSEADTPDYYPEDRQALATPVDRMNTPEWRDGSGHWIGGNVGMPEAAIDDEAKDRADPRADGRLTEAYADGYVDGRMDATPDLAAIDDEAKGHTEDRDEVVRRAMLYVMQMSDEQLAAFAPVALIRALEQDGWTVAAIDDEAKG